MEKFIVLAPKESEMKRIKLDYIKRLDGTPFMIPDKEGAPPREVNLVDVLRMLLRIIPKATMADG